MVEKGDDKGWVWILAIIPAMNGEWVFQAKEKEWEGYGEDGSKVTTRRMTKVIYGQNQDPKDGKVTQIMDFVPWAPKIFKVIDDETEGTMTLERGMVPYSIEAPQNLIDEVMAKWIEELITPANEKMAKQVAKKHNAADKFLKGGRIQKP